MRLLCSILFCAFTISAAASRPAFPALDYEFFTAKYFKVTHSPLFFDADECKLGEILKDALVDRYGVSADDTMNARFKRVLSYIIRNLPYSQQRIDFSFCIIQNESLYTLSLPGGIIIFTEGMMKFLLTDDELACVMCHEIAHIENKDNVSLLKYLRVYDSFLRLINNKQYNYEYIKRQILHMYLDYKKETNIEYRADRDGIRLAMALGFKPDAMLDVMTRAMNDKDLRFQFHYHHNGTDRIWKLKYYIEHLDSKRWERILLKNDRSLK